MTEPLQRASCGFILCLFVVRMNALGQVPKQCGEVMTGHWN